jgi:hypothetical protein
MRHTDACGHCPKYEDGCTVYENTEWVNRIGGCGHYPYRDLPTYLSYVDGVIVGRGRVGQQKQKYEDRKYRSKNDGRRKYL